MSAMSISTLKRSWGQASLGLLVVGSLTGACEFNDTGTFDPNVNSSGNDATETPDQTGGGDECAPSLSNDEDGLALAVRVGDGYYPDCQSYLRLVMSYDLQCEAELSGGWITILQSSTSGSEFVTIFLGEDSFLEETDLDAGTIQIDLPARELGTWDLEISLFDSNHVQSSTEKVSVDLDELDLSADSDCE